MKWFKNHKNTIEESEEHFLEKYQEQEDKEKNFQQENKEDNRDLFWDEDDKIRITMLGTSASGKTSFLSGVYQSLILDFDTDLHLILNKKYDEAESYVSIEDIAMVKPGGIIDSFPSGTNETKLYGLILAGREKNYCEFEFMDYRGALVDKMMPGKSDGSDAGILKEQLIRSNSILLFLDAVKISQFQRKRERAFRCQINLINYIFTNLLKGGEHEYHVIVVLTKVDDMFVKAEDKENNYAGLCRKAMEICGQISQICKTFCIVPVSAVGEGNTYTTEEERNGEKIWISRLKEDVIPSPFNIDIVILHACKNILQQKLDSLKKEVAELGADFDNLKSQEKKKGIKSSERNRQLESLGRELSQKYRLREELSGSIKNIQEKKLDDFKEYIHYEKVNN